MPSPLGYTLSEKSLQRINRSLRRLDALPQNVLDGQADGSSGLVWLPWYNDSAEDCPASGVVRIKDFIQVGSGSPGQMVIKGDKPSTTFSRLYGVNSSVITKTKQYGLLTFDSGADVLFDSGTPAFSEGWGPKSGQWTLSVKYPTTANVLGVTDSTTKILRARWQMIDYVLGKASTTSTKGSTAITVTAYGGAGNSEAVTGCDVPSVFNRFADVASGKWVHVNWINGVAYLTAAEC